MSIIISINLDMDIARSYENLSRGLGNDLKMLNLRKRRKLVTSG